MNNDDRFTAWQRFVVASRSDVAHLFWSRKLYRAIALMFRTNEYLLNPGGRHLLNWLTEMYAHEAAMLVRRELDKQSGVLNLLSLLREIENDFEVLISHSQSAELPSRDQVKADRKVLESEVQQVRAYAERVLAHRTSLHPQELGLRELDHAIKVVADTMRKYHNYVNAADLLSPTPTAGFDWLAPFRVAWLTRGWREPNENEEIDA
jgi:hypothetical protein